MDVSPRKRGLSPSGDVSVVREAPLSKKFKKLSIRDQRARDRITKTPYQRRSSPSPPPHLKQQYEDISNGNSEFMQMDESPHKIYVFDIDAEAKSDNEEDDGGGSSSKVVFLSDIEKKFTQIPMHVLKGDSRSTAPPLPTITPPPQSSASSPLGKSTEIILYKDPASLSVPSSEQDTVRKIILEARARSRQKLAEKNAANDTSAPALQNKTFEVDPDAMDIG